MNYSQKDQKHLLRKYMGEMNSILILYLRFCGLRVYKETQQLKSWVSEQSVIKQRTYITHHNSFISVSAAFPAQSRRADGGLLHTPTAIIMPTCWVFITLQVKHGVIFLKHGFDQKNILTYYCFLQYVYTVHWYIPACGLQVINHVQHLYYIIKKNLWTNFGELGKRVMCLFLIM